MSRLLTRQVQFTLDALILITAFALAYLLRYDFAIPQQEIPHALIQILYVVPLQFAALVITGVYALIWRYISLGESNSFFKAMILASAPVVVLRLALTDQFHAGRVPVSVIFMDTLLALCGLLGVRLARRVLYERFKRESKTVASGGVQSVLLVGADCTGKIVAQEILDGRKSGLRLVGFVDDESRKQGMVIHGVKVLGTTQDIPRLLREHKVKHVLVGDGQTARQEYRRIVDICRRMSVRVRAFPHTNGHSNAGIDFNHVRDVQIEDLLGREPVRLEDYEVRKLLTGKSVMITGAGGSIGSELARQVAGYEPSLLLLLERSEESLLKIRRELRERLPGQPLESLLADIADEKRLRALLEKYRPQVVLHAAAHKHVPMLEYNPSEAIKNNVLGTQRLGELSGECGVETFVLISTDKAVRPTSVMGASKRIAELTIQDLNRHFATRFVAVRFGNVIGSAGSVIPIFREQIRKGGPVTVTHPEMVRYFMTIPEAAQLVLQAATIGDGGEIFILDMGEHVRILDVAKDIIALSGLKPFEDIPIIFTGIRPGEKLFEELKITEENMRRTRHPKIFIGKIASYSEEKMREALKQLELLADAGQELELRKLLAELLPEANLTLNDPALTGSFGIEIDIDSLAGYNEALLESHRVEEFSNVGF